ncbi:MAG: type II toxin-antitoxin system RelB/DinJ family antitoxin [Rickettsiales bacterium]|nr:type II toxin-antitoxin system RelB/DinJ family antitoxin [Rickettsiales bacterium]
MAKSANIHARIQPDVKQKVESILLKLGISISEAISLYFNQISLNRGLPFEVKIPNKKTSKVISEAKKGKNIKRFKSVNDLMKDLEC